MVGLEWRARSATWNDHWQWRTKEPKVIDGLYWSAFTRDDLQKWSLKKKKRFRQAGPSLGDNSTDSLEFDRKVEGYGLPWSVARLENGASSLFFPQFLLTTPFPVDGNAALLSLSLPKKFASIEQKQQLETCDESWCSFFPSHSSLCSFRSLFDSFFLCACQLKANPKYFVISASCFLLY